MSHRNAFGRPLANVARSIVLAGLFPALSRCTSTESGGTGESADTGTSENTVTTKNLKFMPSELTVKAGTTVIWENGETIGHTVTSGEWGDVNENTRIRGTQTPDGLFDHDQSPKGQDGDSFSYTFDEPGEYFYYCEIHLTMNSKVIVEP